MSDDSEDPDSPGPSLDVDLDALDGHAAALREEVDDLEPTVRMLADGDANAVTAFAHVNRGFERIDPVDLKLGAFDDARALAERYKAGYDELAEQVDRIGHAITTAAERVEGAASAYRDADAVTTADFDQIATEFED